MLDPWFRREPLRLLLIPAFALAAGAIGAVLAADAGGLAAGYLLPLSAFLLVHFALHYDEIRRLAAPR